MSIKGSTKDWRVLYTYPDMEKPGTIVCTTEGDAVSQAGRIQLRGGRADVVHVRPVSKERVIVRTFEYLPDPPEGFERCPNCGGAHEMSANGYYTKHVIGFGDEPCSQPESPDEHGPFVIALPDFHVGDKVTHVDTDFADLAEEEHEAVVGTVSFVEPARVRVSWPMSNYEWESPHELRTVNVAYVHDGSRREPVRVRIPKAPRDVVCSVAPPLDHASMMAMHRPEGVPDVTGDHDGSTARFAGDLDARDHRITVSGPDGRVLAVTRDVECRLGNIAARVLGDAGYAVIGLLTGESTPGDPVYAVGPRRRRQWTKGDDEPPADVVVLADATVEIDRRS